MSAIIARLKAEPAVVIGTLAAAALAAFQYLGGREVISPDVVATVQNALDPNGGWFYLLAIGVVTRFFVSPTKA
jgi:hypothetical protein